MNEVIAFRICDVILSSDAVFDSSIPASQQRLFRTVSCMRPYTTTTQEQGIMLNGRKYTHLLYTHKEIEVTISSDEIPTEDDIKFFESFWEAAYKYIALIQFDGSWDGSKYIEVMTEGGRFPVEYIDGLSDLPEVSFKLLTVNPEA